MNNLVKKLLDTPMSRKQFLLHVGAVAMTVTGAAGIMKALTDTHKHRQAGYSSNPYGGNRTDQPRKNTLV